MAGASRPLWGRCALPLLLVTLKLLLRMPVCGST